MNSKDFLIGLLLIIAVVVVGCHISDLSKQKDAVIKENQVLKESNALLVRKNGKLEQKAKFWYRFKEFTTSLFSKPLREWLMELI
jgi:hypothetical protein